MPEYSRCDCKYTKSQGDNQVNHDFETV